MASTRDDESIVAVSSLSWLLPFRKLQSKTRDFDKRRGHQDEGERRSQVQDAAGQGGGKRHAGRKGESNRQGKGQGGTAPSQSRRRGTAAREQGGTAGKGRAARAGKVGKGKTGRAGKGKAERQAEQQEAAQGEQNKSKQQEGNRRTTEERLPSGQQSSATGGKSGGGRATRRAEEKARIRQRGTKLRDKG